MSPQILAQLDAIEDIKGNQKEFCVPVSVCQHLEQCIKETEVQYIQKSFEQCHKKSNNSSTGNSTSSTALHLLSLISTVGTEQITKNGKSLYKQGSYSIEKSLNF